MELFEKVVSKGGKGMDTFTVVFKKPAGYEHIHPITRRLLEEAETLN